VASRFNATVYLKGYADGREVCAGIAAWIAFYNGRRPHQALGNRTPMAIWREGVTGLLADNAVDMTLRLDDSRAPSTCPPRQLQQQQMPQMA
jgi:putative transposase